MKIKKIAVTNRYLSVIYNISIETSKGGPRTLDWAQGLAVD